MKSKLQQLSKLFLIILLFSYGLIIAGAVFPALNLIYSANRAKTKRDALKIHWIKGFSAIINLSVTTEGELTEPGTLLVSNHISWLDIIVFGQLIPACFVAKSDILSWPIIGFLSKQSGTIFIRRGDKQTIKETTEQIAWALKQNSTIIAFPEGTTTSGDKVLNFHASLFQSALLTKSAIQPAAIQYRGLAQQQAPFIGEDDFLRHLLRMLSLDKIKVHVSFLPVIKGAEMTRQSVSIQAREKVWEKLSESMPTAHSADYYCKINTH